MNYNEEMSAFFIMYIGSNNKKKQTIVAYQL